MHSSPVRLGKSAWSVDPQSDMEVTAFSIYDRVLSQTEIQDMYSKGSVNPCYVEGTGLINYAYQHM